jgi:hypothetical protein
MGTALLEGPQGNESNCYHLGDSMNERIQQLAEQATTIVDMVGPQGYTSSYANFDREKFAELIVRECADRATWAQDTGESDIGGEVLKHFGVEE